MRWIFIILPFLFLSCERDDDDVRPARSLQFGYTFGFCGGYCNLDVDITNGNAELLSFANGTNSGNPDRFCTQDASAVENTLWNLVDMDVFRTLPAVIGCPDCADGGAEWIDINDGSTQHKITIEFGADIVEIQNLLIALRAQRDLWGDDCFN